MDSVHWIKGVISRTYPVTAEPNTNITLWDSDGLNWSDKTDSDGKTSFNLTFDKQTYTKEYKIESSKASAIVNFLTDTPIDLTAVKTTATTSNTSSIEPEEPQKKETNLTIPIIIISIVLSLLAYLFYIKK